MRLKMAAIVAGVIMMASTAWAGTLNYNFSAGLSGQQGTSLSYTQGGYTITAYGYQVGQPGNTPEDLYVKTSGGDESGLGLANEYDHEIESNQFVQLNLTNLVTAGMTNGDLTIGSVQSGEGYSICTSSALGTLGNCPSSGDGQLNDQAFSVSWSASDPYLSIRGWVPPDGNSKANVLVMDFSTSAPTSDTPEPASLALMGTGLLCVAFAYRRLRSESPAKAK